MKTLYININNEQINSTEDLEVISYDLDNDFFFHLGEKIANGCKVKNERELITDFNTSENEDAYNDIISQWKKLKEILFSENCRGNFNFTLPEDYIHWLKFNINTEYISIYDANFSNRIPAVIHINLNDLYDDTIVYLQRKIFHILQKYNLHLKIKEIVFNDNAISYKSQIVKQLRAQYRKIDFCQYKKYTEQTGTKLLLLPEKAQSKNEFITEVRRIEHNTMKSKPYKQDLNSYSNAGIYSWQTDEYRAIIKQDQDKYTLEKEFENDTDTAGNKMSQYLEVFNLIIGKSTKSDVYKQQGKLNDAHKYKLPNGVFGYITYPEVIDCVIINKNAQNSIPHFYKKIGCYWGMKGTEFIGVFEKLGFTCVKGCGHVRAIRKCKKYNFCVEIKATYKNSEYIDMTSFELCHRK